jgi:uracil-DNA glycosylase
LESNVSNIVFIGQQPSRYEDEGLILPVRPGSSGDRLIKMMGVTEAAFREHFDCVNLSPYYDPDGFSPAYNIKAAQNLRPLLRGKRVVLLGPAVAEAFEIDRTKYEFCQFFDHPTWEHHGLFTVIPHPSGANRVYNSPEMYNMVVSTLNLLWELRDK